MSITVFGIIVCVLGLLLKGPARLYLLVVCTLFGATAAAFLGGATITPAVMASPFFLWLTYSAFTSPNRPHFVIDPRTTAFWGIAFTAYAIFTAFVFPKIFNDGSIIAYMNDRAQGGTATAILEPIRPVSTNITQSLYLASNIFIYLGASYLIAYWKKPSLLSDAFLLAAFINIVLAFLNTLQQFGLPDLLLPIKNGSYFMLGGSVGGLVRISGGFPETSGWSAYTLGIFGFTKGLWINGYRTKISGPITVATLFFLLLSTSGTAYGGLAIIALISYALLAYRYISNQKNKNDIIYIRVLAAFVLASIAIIVFKPEAIDAISNFFEVAVGRKLESESGMTRSDWNSQAWNNFIDTYGFGTGLGTNISSGFISLLPSNTGWFGALLFSTFLLKSLTHKNKYINNDATALISAGKWGMLGVLSAASFSARVFDLGMTFFLFAAAATFSQNNQSKLQRH